VLGAEVGFFHCINKGVDWVFVDHPSYHGRDGLYADANGVYQDNQVGPVPPEDSHAPVNWFCATSSAEIFAMPLQLDGRVA
jgi:hypothetical protein